MEDRMSANKEDAKLGVPCEISTSQPRMRARVFLGPLAGLVIPFVASTQGLGLGLGLEACRECERVGAGAMLRGL